MPAPAKLAQKGHKKNEDNPGGAQIAVASILVEPVGIDDAVGARQLGAGKMMVDNDDIHAGIGDGGKRLVGRDAAIDGEDEPGAVLLEFGKGLPVRAVPLLLPVWNMDIDRQAEFAKNTHQKRRRRRAVDIIVAEDADWRARLHRVGEPFRGPVHVLESRGVRQKVADGRRQIAFMVFDAGDLPREDIARRKGQALVMFGKFPGAALEWATWHKTWRGPPGCVAKGALHTKNSPAHNRMALAVRIGICTGAPRTQSSRSMRSSAFASFVWATSWVAMTRATASCGARPC